MQEGDVLATWADVVGLEACFNYKTQTTIREGIERFIRWYKRRYKHEN